MSKLFLIFTSLTLGMITGCRSNPYPDQGELVTAKPSKPSAAFNLDAPAEVYFQEGVTSEFILKISVPSGKALVSFQGLPKDAQYLPAEEKVVWQPPFDAANDAGDPKIVQKLYPVTITVQDSNDLLSIRQQTVVIVVSDVQRDFDLVNFTSSSSLTEGKSFSQDIKINDVDFPHGPFSVQTDGLPAGATITADSGDPTLFHLVFIPDFGFVKADDYGSKTVNWTLNVVDPRLRKITNLIDWNVTGNRQNPAVFIPEKVNQGPPNVSFMLNVIDPNGETIPVVTANTPVAGKIELELVGSSPGTATSKPFQLINVKWTGIPKGEAGKTETLTFESCVLDSQNSMSQCIDTNVPVYLNGGN